MARSHLIPSSLAGLGVLALALAPAGPASAATIDPSGFAQTVTADGVYAHLEQLQAIADANDGNRAAGTSGYEASGAYIEQVLEAAGYTPERRYFETTVQTVASASLSVEGLALDPAPVILEFSPATEPPTGVTAGLVVPNGATPESVLGCDAAAWEGVDAAGSIALVQRGTCAFAAKSAAANAAGAVGIIVYNNVDEPLAGTLGAEPGDYAPGFGVTQSQGEEILAALETDPELTATLAIDQTTSTVETFNVIAQTPTGRDDNVVMLGAHLDSVTEGPGINDNGSGSAAILETAVQLAGAGELNNAVRFAWWGAEEIGLVGSTHYVDDLVANDPGALDEIATYLNFDMVGSPNYIIGVYDADESTYPAPVEVPAGSIETERLFTDYFDSIGQPWVDTEFSGRSDYQAFIDNGVAASGLFTGADDVKAEEEVALFGGTAGITHDPNYHTPADDLGNVDVDALGINAAAIGYVTASLANDTSAVNGVLPPAAPETPAEPVPGDEPDGATPAGELARTGANPVPGLAAGGAVAVLGLLALLVARRRAEVAGR